MKSNFAKDQIRSYCQTWLRQFSAAEAGQRRAQAEAKIQKNLLRFLQETEGIWAAFRPMGFEPRITSVFEASKSQIEWAYPRISGEVLEWWVPGRSDDFGFEKGTLSFDEPKIDSSSRHIAVEQLTGVLIPGLGFDPKGVRLGRGKGHFDKSLKAYKGKKIAVAFACQLVEDIPAEAHDIKMDCVITEHEVIAC